MKLQDSFYEKETRSGFVVTSYRKRCWARLLNLLCVFDEFAKKYSLNYCLGFGTLLGAVRHKGFIPWDDDIDVVMARDEFMRMKECAREYFAGKPQGIVYEDSYDETTDHRWYISKLRDTNTTVAEPWMMESGVFTGMFLDIFPLDAASMDAADRSIRTQLWLASTGDRRLRSMMDSGVELSLGRDTLEALWSMPYSDKMRVFDEYLLSRWGHNDKVCDAFKDIEFSGEKNSDLKDWKETVLLPFEGMEFPVPAGWDHILTCEFGDYMKPVRGLSWHEGAFMDPDTPYEEYTKGNKTIPDDWENLM